MLDQRKILGVFILAIALFGCSVDSRYKVMSFIFDGVPNPYDSSEVVVNDTLTIVDSITTMDQTASISNPQIFFHSPYQKRKCKDCHDQNNMGGLEDQMPGLCYNCHDNLAEKYAVLHGPVGAGYCNACHHPHYSKHEHLLLKDEQELCLDCHLEEDIYSNKLHAKQDDHICQDCHNVHGGDDISLQKPGTCYKCHQDMRQKYNYLHGPVGGGYCKSCHGSHTLNTKSILARQGRSLCLHCHDESRIMETETHQELEDADCIMCHDPHGGETMNFLY